MLIEQSLKHAKSTLLASLEEAKQALADVSKGYERYLETYFETLLTTYLEFSPESRVIKALTTAEQKSDSISGERQLLEELLSRQQEGRSNIIDLIGIKTHAIYHWLNAQNDEQRNQLQIYIQAIPYPAFLRIEPLQYASPPTATEEKEDLETLCSSVQSLTAEYEKMIAQLEFYRYLLDRLNHFVKDIETGAILRLRPLAVCVETAERILGIVKATYPQVTEELLSYINRFRASFSDNDIISTIRYACETKKSGNLPQLELHRISSETLSKFCCDIPLFCTPQALPTEQPTQNQQNTIWLLPSATVPSKPESVSQPERRWF